MQVGGADFVAVEFLLGSGEIPDVFQEENNLMRDRKAAWRVVEGFATKKAKGVDGDVVIDHARCGLDFISDGKRLRLVAQVSREVGKCSGNLGLGKCEQLLEGRAISQRQSTFRSVAVGIGSEDFYETALVAQFLDGAGDLGVVGMALDVDVEKIFPCFTSAWAALDLGHV